ncbi:hypothetical protein HAV15_005885 [Penicillium sp. str. |nr:hypothetical protein HAV15_005885 [Penicillium sp. str. \
MANAPVSRYHPGSLTARFRKMLEDDRSVESSGHEDSTTPCPEANGPIDTDRDRELSHQDRLENRHGQKIRRKERSVQSSSSRPYDQQQSASRQAIKRAKLLESKVKIRQRKNFASDVEKLNGDLEVLKEEMKSVKKTLASMRSNRGTGHVSR